MSGWQETGGRAYSELRVSNDHLADPAALEAAWRRDGYLFFRSVLDANEVSSVRRLIEAELLEQGIMVPAEGGAGVAWSGKPMEGFDDAYMHSLPQRYFPQLLETPTTTAFLEAVFGEPVRLWGASGSTLRHIMPNDPLHVSPPHQDRVYIRHTDLFRTLWLPLAPVPPEAGPLAVAEASHLSGLRDHEEQEAFSYVLPGRRQLGVALRDIPERWCSAEYQPGDALLFHSELLYLPSPVPPRCSCRL